ncbi:MAG: hypothetical protein SRB2_03131 [Desulfobacteraceae bacterium Eth-SRB2]|nr:MAG: hypothetical protein SRB2_03131 [Desulfobacteraceae bacterium Eth-SRB2]
MDKKVLVAIDDSENAMRAVEFIANSFTKDNKITLFNVIQDTAALCEMNSPELTPYFKSQQSSFCLLEEKKQKLVNQAVEKAKEILTDAGFDENNITVKSELKKSGWPGISLKKPSPVIMPLSWEGGACPGLRILSSGAFHRKYSIQQRIFQFYS